MTVNDIEGERRLSHEHIALPLGTFLVPMLHFDKLVGAKKGIKSLVLSFCSVGLLPQSHTKVCCLSCFISMTDN